MYKLFKKLYTLLTSNILETNLTDAKHPIIPLYPLLYEQSEVSVLTELLRRSNYLQLCRY
jgi:hypothetical protein